MKGLKHIDDEVLELIYQKEIDEDQDLELEISVSYRLDFDEEERMCYGDAQIYVDDVEHNKLSVRLHTVGIFSYKEQVLTDEVRRELHRETVKELNPYWNNLMVNFTMLAGIPPIELEPMEFDDSDIELNTSQGLN